MTCCRSAELWHVVFFFSDYMFCSLVKANFLFMTFKILKVGHYQRFTGGVMNFDQ